MNTFLTADWHLFHKRCAISRGFLDWKETDQAVIDEAINTMNGVIIDNINSRVKPNDTLYVLGDVSLRKDTKVLSLLHFIKCKLILVKGNHDQKDIYNSKVFQSSHDYKEIKHNGHHIVLFHYPLATWNRKHYGAFNLHGHSHGSYPGNSQQMDVGIDTNNLMPYSIEECFEKMATLPKCGKADYHD